MTRDYVLGARGGHGDRARSCASGGAPPRASPGYDLVGLMVGSEGTLGVITEVTVRLRPRPPQPARTVVGFFDTLPACGAAVAGGRARRAAPRRVRADRPALPAAVNAWKNTGLPEDADALLLAQTDAARAGRRARRPQAIRRAASRRPAPAEAMHRPPTPAEAEALFAARRLAYPALERLGTRAHRGRLPAPRPPGRDARPDRGRSPRGTTSLIANVAHAGDGNLHPLSSPPRRRRRPERAQAAFDEIIDAAIDLGGTVTGEHGVGLLKRAGMEREIGPDVLAMHRAIKAALDPQGILNPGKAVG